MSNLTADQIADLDDLDEVLANQPRDSDVQLNQYKLNKPRKSRKSRSGSAGAWYRKSLPKRRRSRIKKLSGILNKTKTNGKPRLLSRGGFYFAKEGQSAKKRNSQQKAIGMAARAWRARNNLPPPGIRYPGGYVMKKKSSGKSTGLAAKRISKKYSGYKKYKSISGKRFKKRSSSKFAKRPSSPVGRRVSPRSKPSVNYRGM